MKRAIVLLVVLILMVVSLNSKSIDFNKRVNDLAGILTASQITELTAILENIEKRTTAQVAVVIIDSLNGRNLEDYSINLAQNWGKNKGLGQKKLDNGVLILVAMKERKIRIEVGYGLEPVLTDGKCGYIIRALMVPYFKSKQYYQGIKNAVVKIRGVITKESDISEEDIKKYQKKKESALSVLFKLFILLIIILSVFIPPKNRKGGGGFWYGGFGGSSGGGGFGGFSGGGGGFGGGGASGGW